MIKEFVVKGMHCKSCEMLLKESIMDCRGVLEVNASSANEKIKVIYDEQRITEKEIKDIIKKEGYVVK